MSLKSLINQNFSRNQYFADFWPTGQMLDLLLKIKDSKNISVKKVILSEWIRTASLLNFRKYSFEAVSLVL